MIFLSIFFLSIADLQVTIAAARSHLPPSRRKSPTTLSSDPPSPSVVVERNSLSYDFSPSSSLPLPFLLSCSMMTVREDNDNPPEFNRKRKLTADRLSLPAAKHECLRVISENAQVKSAEDNRMLSDHESGNDCNSVINNVGSSSDCTMSLSEPKFEASKICPSSTLSFNWSSESCNKDDPQCSSDNDATASSARDYDKFQETDEMLDYENRFGYTYTEYNGSGGGGDEDLDSDLCANSGNPRVYLLSSSGGWTVKQEAQSGTRAPTIDQEFEQYFSGLMLQ